MSDSEYLIDGQVITYWGGRKDTDTATWRDATDLELKQQAEIDSLTAELEQVKAERDRLKVRLSVTEKLLPRAGRDY